MNYQQHIITEPAANFRSLARQGLGGRWGDAILKAFIYSLVLNVPITIINSFGSKNIDKLYAQMMSGKISVETFSQSAILSPLTNLFQLLVAGALAFGIASVYLRYRRGQEAPNDLLFSGFSKYGKTFALFFVMSIFIALWTLLLIVPGIIAAYRYRLAWYILIDNPEVGVLEAISISKGLMSGNKWKLFCLDISFIGWAMLSALAALLVSGLPGILLGSNTAVSIASTVIQGLCFAPLMMYTGTADAAFYERASGLLKYSDEVGQQETPAEQ